MDSAAYPAPEPTPQSGEPEEASAGESVPVAIRELLQSLRGGAADVADLIAAEAHLALRLLITMVLSAVAVIVLGVLALAALVGTLISELIDNAVSPTAAMFAVALLCLLGCALLVFELRRLAKRILFGRSRRLLRGSP